MLLFLEIYFGVPLILYVGRCIKRKKFRCGITDTLKTVLLWPFIILVLIWDNLWWLKTY